MKFIITIPLVIFTISCSGNKHVANEYETVPHVHDISNNQKVAFEGRCATGVMHGNCSVLTKKDIFFDHEDTRYYFSSEAARNEFKKDIKKNILRANKSWEDNRVRAGDRL